MKIEGRETVFKRSIFRSDIQRMRSTESAKQDLAISREAGVLAHTGVVSLSPQAKQKGVTQRSPERASGSPRPVGIALVGAVCAVSIVWGWSTRDALDMAADEGLGYGLGIAGLAMMAALLTYSLRKRVRAARGLAPLRVWFEAHMMLGLLGPTAILFHANFALGSMNGNVALFSMLFVAGSGILGRFVYTRIHHGLLGQRATMHDLRDDLSARRRSLARALDRCPRARAELERFESYALGASGGPLKSLKRFLLLRFRERASRRSAERALLQAMGAGRGEASSLELRACFRAVRRAAEFASYELLFSSWHALHLPLCLLLFASAVAHVVAVHLY